MAVIKSISQSLKVVKLTANTTHVFSGFNESDSTSFIFADPLTDIKITEVSTTQSNLTGIVTLDRLVFNPSQLDIGQITLDEINNKFTTTGSTIVGYYGSAYHNGISVNKDCLLLLKGRKDWKEFA
jgi:hypothetical protein